MRMALWRLHRSSAGSAGSVHGVRGLGNVVGHDEAKQGLLLAFLAREHVLLAGPVGSAKSMLAEHFAERLAEKPCVLQLHRDTRAEELTSSGGVLKRSPAHKGELLSFVQVPGRLLEADVCVLDDLNNAPGEALSSLLGALTRQDTALRSAVATANATELLDPALVDRFAVHLPLSSALGSSQWHRCAQLLGAVEREATEVAAAVTGETVEAVTVPGEVRRLLLKVMQALVHACRLAGANWELSDRFLVKALKLVRAHALSEGRKECQAADLYALRFLTAFRVPWAVHQRVMEIIRSVLESAEPKEARGDWATTPVEGLEETAMPRPWEDGVQSEQIEGKDAGGESVDATEGEGGDSGGSGQSGRQSGDQTGEGETTSGRDATDNFQRRQDEVTSHQHDLDELSGSGQGQNAGAAEAAGLLVPEDLLATKMGLLDVDALSVANIEQLLDCVCGSIDRGRTELAEHPGGSPRRYKRWDFRDMSDFAEVDPWEMHNWSLNPSPAVWPRCRQRLKRCKGGLVALLRDVSMSMAGVNATWGSRVTLGLLEACRERDMSFGYIEFNHHSKKFRGADGSFFSTDYEALCSLAMRLQCNGWTNYSTPLQEVLEEFQAFSLKGTDRSLRGQAHMAFLLMVIQRLTRSAPGLSSWASSFTACTWDGPKAIPKHSLL